MFNLKKIFISAFILFPSAIFAQESCPPCSSTEKPRAEVLQATGRYVERFGYRDVCALYAKRPTILIDKARQNLKIDYDYHKLAATPRYEGCIETKLPEKISATKDSEFCQNLLVHSAKISQTSCYCCTANPQACSTQNSGSY
ncbi:hypothetical protein JNK13_00320 [bacterium]|nr:hypothetical protein [bacterium]